MPLEEAELPINSRPGTWALRIGVVCITLAISPLMWQGIVSWRNDDLLRGVVIRFFQAIADGDRKAALRELSIQLQQRLPHSSELTAHATPNVRIQIVKVLHDEKTATVQASIGKQGFSLKPAVRLEQDHQGIWKIIAIEGLHVDPRWTSVQTRQAGEELASEITDQLQRVH